ncbi:MAG: anaerobic ribonucleoside-triphosphate reductase [Spirochaetaceae bacterium]
MRDLETIDREIAELKERLAGIEGTPTEIYTRIVGYYRSLTNWNRGKSEEYRHRRTFDYTASGAGAHGAELRTGAASDAGAGTGTGAASDAGTGTGADDSAPAAERHGYAYFFRTACPNCPPVRSVLERTGLSGVHYDVDTDEGFAKAAELQILSTPTVVFFDETGRETGRATTPRMVDELTGAPA